MIISTKRWSLILLILCLTAAVLTGCGQKPAETEAPATAVTDTSNVETSAVTDASEASEEPAQTEEPAESEMPAETEAPSKAEESAETQVPVKAEESVPAEEPSLWVGTVQSGFKNYPITTEGDLTPDQLIAELASLTGWNLDLAEPTTTGKGGMSVVFTKDCSLVAGPPMVQKDEFLVLDNYSLANWVLDSIEATLQHYFVLAPGDPSSLDIYFSVEMEPIVVEDRTLPIDQPWDSESFFS